MEQQLGLGDRFPVVGTNHWFEPDKVSIYTDEIRPVIRHLWKSLSRPKIVVCDKLYQCDDGYRDFQQLLL
jgi:hypothetical protein